MGIGRVRRMVFAGRAAVVVGIVLVALVAEAFPALALPVGAQPTTPANNAVVGTVTPVLTGAGQSGSGLSFQFLISSTDDPTVGTVYTSDWLGSPSLTVPGGNLHDGVTYSWKIGTKDSSGTVWSTVAKFKVNLRLGDQTAAPWDAPGGVKVDLANGNLLYSVSSGQIQTAGGPLGVTFTYNSQQPSQASDLSLSPGWTLSTDTQGSLSYQQLVVAGDDLVLVEPSGATHEYRRADNTTTNAWLPQDDDDATVSQNGSGQYVVVGDDGLTYLFDSGGRLLSATTATDQEDGTPPAGQAYDLRADPNYVWNGSGQLTNINDRLSPARGLTLTYAGFNGAGCPTQGVTPSLGKLCKIQYVDNYGQMEETDVYYDSSQRLTTVLNPGGERTDIVYGGTSFLISGILSTLANDAIAAGQRTSSDLLKTLVFYDASGRVSEVDSPLAEASDASRPVTTYGYTVPDTNFYATQTDVHVAGTTQPNGYTRRVTMNTLGQETQELDAAGKATTWEWWPDDRIRWTQVPGGNGNYGLRTSTIYDAHKRPTDIFGPYSPGCFNDDQPVSTCNVSHQMKAYDGAATFYDDGASSPPATGSTAIQGLAAAYWKNTSFTGAPFSHETGLGDSSGNMSHDWGTGTPATLSGYSGAWAAQYTGEINLPAAGTYGFAFDVAAGARLYIDNTLVQDHWTGWCCSLGPNGTFNATMAGWHKVRVEYQHDPNVSASAHLNLWWSGPTVSFQIVPGTNLTPRYDLVTSVRDADGKQTNTEYANPERHLATATVADPFALNLRTTMTYEPAGTSYTYGRLLTTQLRKGAASTTTNEYFGVAPSNNETAVDPCANAPVANDPPASSIQAIPQGGQLALRTHPDPAGPDGAIVDAYEYDRMGRIMASSSTNSLSDPLSCTHYDARGRVRWTQDRVGRTATTTYTGVVTTTSYTDSATAPGTQNRTTIAEVDLDGRLYRYTDEWGTITTRKYDQAGRLIETDRQFPGQPNGILTTQTYDTGGRVASITDDASGLARTTTYGYDDGGNVTSVTRPNGVGTYTQYDVQGDVSTVSTESATASYQGEAYTHSGAHRVLADILDSEQVNYAYDGAGRLVTVSDYSSGFIKRSYAYDANTNRCATTDSTGVQAACNGSYSVDEADRITASPYASAYQYDSRGNVVASTGKPGYYNMHYTYDGNDHATSIDDGIRTSTDTLAPSGRVLERKITFDTPVSVESDTIYGFDGSGDSPAYSRPANGTWPTPILLADDWTGTNNAGWNAAKWVTTTNDSSKKVDIQNDQGRFYVVSGSARATAQMSSAADMEASLTYQFNENTTGSFLRLFLRASGATGGSQMPNAYRLEVGSNSTSIVLQRFVNSVVTQIGSFPYTSGTAAQRVRFRVQGSTIEAKVWAAGTAEPSSWSIVVTDSGLSGSGVVQIAHSFSSGTHTVYVDDLDVTDLNKTSVTTYTNGPSGMLSTDTNGEVSYALADLHGDIVGNLDIAGGDAGNYVDEYGAHLSRLPQNRLDWLGSKERFIEDAPSGNGATIRMGVRLYDSLIGRFIQTDPVDGGSANAYDYGSGDPINNFDLGGLCAKKRGPLGWSRNQLCHVGNIATKNRVSKFAGKAVNQAVSDVQAPGPSLIEAGVAYGGIWGFQKALRHDIGYLISGFGEFLGGLSGLFDPFPVPAPNCSGPYSATCRGPQLA